MMMSVAFAIRRDVGQLSPVAAVGIRVQQAIREDLAIIEKALKGDSARDRAIVEKDRDLLPDGVTTFVSACRIYASTAYINPTGVADLTESVGLMGSEDRVLDAEPSHDSSDFEVDAVSGSHMPSGDRPNRLRNLLYPR